MNMRSYGIFLLHLQGVWWHSLLSLLLLFAAARGIGVLLLPRRRDEFIRVALGAAVLAWLYPWWLRVPPRWAGCLLLIPAAGAWDIPWRNIKRHWPLYAILFLFGAYTLASAFLPPYIWDEQVYQTVLWSRYPEALRRIDNPYAAYPLLPHFFMMWMREWGGLSLPRLTVWALSLVLAGKLYLETAKRSESPVFGAVAAAVVMFSPLALVLHNGFYAESFIALFALAGFLVLECGDEFDPADGGDEVRRQLLAGVFAGACVAVKLTGVGAALMLTILASKRRRLQWFVLAAAVTALPFFIRPYLVFGNPFYPFGSALWGGEKARIVENVSRALGDYGPGKFVGMVTGWLAVCFMDGRSYDGVVCGFGVMALIILMLAAMRIRRDKASLVTFGALAAGYVFWAMTSQQSRFLYPLLFPLVLLLADNFQAFAGKRKRLLALSLPVLGVALSWSWLRPQLRSHVTAWRIVGMARRDPENFLFLTTGDVAYFNSLILLDKVAPKDARVLLICERRSLYVPRNCEQGSPLFQEARLTPAPRTAEELWQGIKDFDYVLLGSGEGHVDHLDSYDEVEKRVGWQIVSLQRRGRLVSVMPPAGVECQPLLKVVHEP